MGVSGSVSLLLALLGTASAAGAWCALVGMPPLGAEAATEFGVNLSRLVFIPDPGSGWITAVGALLAAFDVVVTRPPARLAPGEVQRLAARVRTSESVLMPFLTGQASWPGVGVRLDLRDGHWSGPANGRGWLRQRRVTVVAEGRGRAARPTSVSLWLPAAGGGVAACEQIAPVVELPARVG